MAMIIPKEAMIYRSLASITPTFITMKLMVSCKWKKNTVWASMNTLLSLIIDFQDGEVVEIRRFLVHIIQEQ
jgi:hypothetical protein